MNKRVSANKEILDMDCKGWEVNIPPGIHPPLWASSSKRKGYGLQILVKIVLGENSSLKIKKKKKIYLSIRLERATNSPETLLPSVRQPYPLSEQSSLRMGEVSRSQSERRKRGQEEAPSLSTPQNQQLWNLYIPWEWYHVPSEKDLGVDSTREGWVILFQAQLSWLRGKGPTTLSAVAAAPWASHPSVGH